MRHHGDPERRRFFETASRVGLALTGGLLVRPGLSLFPAKPPRCESAQERFAI